MIPVSEGQIKNGIQDYLEVLQSQGKLLWFRMNSGTYVMGKGTPYQRVIRGCKAGTSDFLVLQRWYPQGAPNKVETIAYFIEVKRPMSKQNQAQLDFQKLVESMGHCYIVVRDVESVIKILGG